MKIHKIFFVPLFSFLILTSFMQAMEMKYTEMNVEYPEIDDPTRELNNIVDKAIRKNKDLDFFSFEINSQLLNGADPFQKLDNDQLSIIDKIRDNKPNDLNAFINLIKDSRRLKEYNANPDNPTAQLFDAVQENDLEKASKALALGANPNTPEYEFLINAIKKKNPTMIRLLLRYNADPSRTSVIDDITYPSALEYAQKHNQKLYNHINNLLLEKKKRVRSFISKEGKEEED